MVSWAMCVRIVGPEPHKSDVLEKDSWAAVVLHMEYGL